MGFTKEMHNYYSNKIMHQLTHIRNNETGKLRFYSKIVPNFMMQKYLTFNINKYLRSHLTKLRLSAHSLAIETGRYCKPVLYQLAKDYVNLVKIKLKMSVTF